MTDQELELQKLTFEMARVASTSEGDQESAHSQADEILCKALELLGQQKLVKAFRIVDKWYA